ncbi:hypothetical protein [Novosphingobium pokkalii]|uniref:Uncharacterized protein n=1 Tax=Novosphingobium pokkalii TaxID=1770194 RepID=A0ABV7V7V3_9SPHN|nr:hypothetical protein [Novosphingobium pokkalii]GHD01790.1 hypothetical protein GCM10019060_36480 [Novosphingobium pokkalii]
MARALLLSAQTVSGRLFAGRGLLGDEPVVLSRWPVRARQALASVPVLGCAAALICAGRALPF